jgi:hypothetical protein
VKTLIAAWLRRWADRIDPNPIYYRRTAYSYTVEETSRQHPLGIAVHADGRGCPLWVIDADWKRAYDEAARDWRSPSEKLSAMLDAHGEPKEDR